MEEASAKDHYAHELSQLLSLEYDDAKVIVSLAWPRIEELDSEDDDIRVFNVTASRFATVLGCLMSGDINAQVHTKEGGFTQTVVIIGMCAAVASRCAPGLRLAKIEPDVSFKAPIPLGDSAMMSVRVRHKSSRASKLELRGWLPGSGKLIFEPRILLMVKVPEDKH